MRTSSAGRRFDEREDYIVMGTGGDAHEFASSAGLVNLPSALPDDN